MLLQAIVIEDDAYEVEKAGKSFINTHVFPGGCLPSMEIIARSVARVTDFRQAHVDDITAHYALTLEHWRERFLAATERLAALGYDERFRRLWELYLSYCEGGFRERRIQDVQLLLAKPRLPLRRSALAAGLRVLARRYRADAPRPVRRRPRRLPRELSHVPGARGDRRGGPLRRVGARRV